jgi:hypothetical protein
MNAELGMKNEELINAAVVRGGFVSSFILHPSSVFL